MLKREDLKVGHKYVSPTYDGITRTVIAIGDLAVFYSTSDGGENSILIKTALDRWWVMPKPKKRYWLWDVKDTNNVVRKSDLYIDDEGRCTTTKVYYSSTKLIKKHEDQFIDVDVD